MKAVFKHIDRTLQRTGAAGIAAFRTACGRIASLCRAVTEHASDFLHPSRKLPAPPPHKKHFLHSQSAPWIGAALILLLPMVFDAALRAAPAPDPTFFRAPVGFGEHRFTVPDEERFAIPGEQRFHAPGRDMYAVAPGSAANATNFFKQAAEEFGLPPKLLSAIAYQESTFHPWAINIKGKTYYPSSKREAVRLLERKKPRSYDVGVMQINSYWIRKYNLDRVELLDPEINIRWGAWILWDCCKRFGSDWKGVAAYHTGHPNTDPPRGKRYAAKVFRHMKRLKSQAE